MRKGSARLVSIVAGRRDDGEMLMDLINRGKVYRFLLKPVSPGRARLAVEASVKHHLEAPDAAFKMSGKAAAPQPAAPKQKAAPAPKPKPAPKPQVKAPKKPPAPQAAPPQKSKPAAKAKAAPVDPPLGEPTIESPHEEGLLSAFDGDDSSFTETVTGLIGSVTRKFEKKTESMPAPAIDSAMGIPEPAAGSGSGGSLLKNPKVIGLAAAAVVAIAGASFWFMGGDDESAIDEPVTVAEPVTSTPTPSITESDVDFGRAAPAEDETANLVSEARLARDAGQIFNPVGSNAIELYAAAVAADPANNAVAAELDAVIEQALAMAETALLESQVADAEAALQRVALADADNGRLPFLSAQLSQIQLRIHLTDARTAIRDNQFEDAGNSIAAAFALNVSDTSEIAAVQNELNEARSDQRVDEVLANANARFEEGNLLNPPNDNARYYYGLVLSSDPENTAARQGLNAVASKLVLQARAEIDAENFNSAAALLDEAGAIDASNTELAATATALSAAQDEIVARERRALEERQRIEAADLKAAEEKAAAERQQAEEAAAQAAAIEAAAVAAATDDGATAETLNADPAAEAIADEVPADEVPAEVVAEEPASEPEPVPVAEQAPVSISSLTRTRYAAPKYPRTAQRRNLSGWVDVVFTVAMDGTVKDVEVRGSEPEDIFNTAAIRAVEKWEFEPIIENGVLAEKRAGVRMLFAFED